MEGGRCASDHRRAVPEPMAMPGGIGLVGTPEGPVGTPLAPCCPPYGSTTPGHGAHTREKKSTPGKIFVFGFGGCNQNYSPIIKNNAFAGVFG